MAGDRILGAKTEKEYLKLAPCGQDSLGTVLEEGEQLICLCCGGGGRARVLGADDPSFLFPKIRGFDYPGSQWVRVSAIVGGDDA